MQYRFINCSMVALAGIGLAIGAGCGRTGQNTAKSDSGSTSDLAQTKSDSGSASDLPRTKDDALGLQDLPQTTRDSNTTSDLPGAKYDLAVGFDLPLAQPDSTSSSDLGKDLKSNDVPSSSDTLDASTSRDSSLADIGAAIDRPKDAFPAAFAEVPGHTFQIAASNTALDASVVDPGTQWACKPTDSTAVYNLVFSTDGSTVQLVRMDGVQEATVTGTLKEQTESRLRYQLNTGPGGAELLVWKNSGVLIAQFTIFGSGVPVISCIQSPMVPI